MSFERFPRYCTSTTNVATASLLLVDVAVGKRGWAADRVAAS
jgi:hypothetical protein